MCEETKDLVTEAAIDTNETVAETMDDLKEDLEKSYQKVQEGDILTGTVIGVSDTEVTVDLKSYAEGIIKAEELSNNPKFSISTDIAVGEAVTCIVLRADDGEGNLLLSKKKADDILAWERLQNLMDEGTVLSVKICGVVNGGVITYVEGIRGFIPASQLSLSYVEDLNTFLNETVDAKVITVDKSKKRLVLSAKEVAKAKAAADKSAKINRVQVGDVFEGKVDKITTYGAFVDFEDGLSGLVHISQISQKHIKSPNEVIKEGETVKVKVIANKDGKISLSIKALQQADEVTHVQEKAFEYKDEGSATTGLGALLKNIKL